MSKSLASIKKEISNKFASSAINYFYNGQKGYFNMEKYPSNLFQAAVGNFAISVELILKAYIAKNAFPFLYQNLPLKLELYLKKPDNFDEDKVLQSHLADLRSFSELKSIDINKAISLFFYLKPSLKDELKPYLRSIKNVRNPSVHSILPSFQKYELERMAFASAMVFKKLHDPIEFFALVGFWDEKKDKIIENYEHKVVQVVKEKIEKAKKSSRSIDKSDIEKPSPTLERYVIDCRICGNPASLFGRTEMDEKDFPDQHDIERNMWFYSHEYKCDYCGLHLESYDEVSKAGLPVVEIRSDKNFVLPFYKYVHQNYEQHEEQF
jgi:hypothetical protein